MSRLGNCNRRSLLLLAATWLLNSRISTLFAEQTSRSPVASIPSRVRSRRYSVQATVMLGAIPIFAKARVGGALLTVEESGTQECGAVAVQFGAGTWPDRLKGFNRFGVTQEVVRIEHGHVAESSYYSFMTTSREANLSQAEQSFRSSIDSVRLTIGYGQSTAAGCTAKIEHEAVPATVSWSDCPKLLDELRERKPTVYQNSAGASQQSVLPTFLYAVRQAVLYGPRHASVLYSHNGEIYRLATETRPANESGQAVTTARICREGSHGGTEFRLWMASDSGAELPFRIEFRAKSFLKLTLELDERESLPVFKPILKETES